MGSVGVGSARAAPPPPPPPPPHPHPKRDVVAHGRVEEDGVLGDDRDERAQRPLGDPPRVDPVKQDAPAVRVGKAEREAEQGGLAGAGRADDRAARAAGDADAHAAEHGRQCRAPRVPHVPELDGAAREGERRRVGRVGDGRDVGQELEHAVHVEHLLLNRAVKRAKPVERDGELADEGDVEDGVADAQGALGDALRAQHQPGRRARKDDGRLDDVEAGEGRHEPVLHRLVARDRGRKPGRLPFFRTEKFDRLVIQQRVRHARRFGVVGRDEVLAELAPVLRRKGKEKGVGECSRRLTGPIAPSLGAFERLRTSLSPQTPFGPYLGQIDGDGDVGGEGDKHDGRDGRLQGESHVNGGSHDVEELRADLERKRGRGMVIVGAGSARPPPRARPYSLSMLSLETRSCSAPTAPHSSPGPARG